MPEEWPIISCLLSHDGTIDSTPVPFHAETKGWRYMEHSDEGTRRWEVRGTPSGLDTSVSNEFHSVYKDTGQLRLVRYYWTRERNDLCNGSAKRPKTARSKVFSIVEKISSKIMVIRVDLWQKVF